MPKRIRSLCKIIAVVLLLAACSNPNPQPPGLTPIPTLAPGATPTLIPSLQGAPSSGGAPAAPGTAGPADPASGASLFERNCSPCHGDEAQGVNGPPLHNSAYIQGTDPTAIAQVVAGGLIPQGMPAWLQANGGPLTDAQINNVIAYLKTLQNVTPVPQATLAPTETPPPPNAPTPEPARPSSPGGPGQAVNLTGDPNRGKVMFGAYCSVCHGPEGIIGVPNPDSDDGSVPSLNPIDPTIANKDKKTFATNVDLFVQNGSVPSGPAPEIAMPAFGELKLLNEQQIADIIAYVISLNSSP
jgi:mono/diheme cytochrome c family protein